MVYILLTATIFSRDKMNMSTVNNICSVWNIVYTLLKLDSVDGEIIGERRHILLGYITIVFWINIIWI